MSRSSTRFHLRAKTPSHGQSHIVASRAIYQTAAKPASAIVRLELQVKGARELLRLTSFACGKQTDSSVCIQVHTALIFEMENGDLCDDAALFIEMLLRL